MTKELKTALISLVTAAIVFLGVYLAYLKGEPDVVDVPTVQVWQNEVYYHRGPLESVPEGVRAYGFTLLDTATVEPSWQGAEVGPHPDVLVPEADLTSAELVRIEAPAQSASLDFGNLILEVTPDVMPPKPLLPMYVRLTSQTVLDVYNKVHGTNEQAMRQVMQTQKYVDFMRSFWLEPFGQGVTHFPWDLDNWGWRQLVLTDNLATPLLWVGNEFPSVEWLQLIDQEVNEAYLHGPDEAATGGVGVAAAAVQIEFLNMHCRFPVLMTTAYEQPAWDGLNILYTFLRTRFSGAYGAFGLYDSCENQGNCVNGAPYNPRPTDSAGELYPVLVVEASEADVKRVVTDARAKGATLLLYYNVAEKLLTYYEDIYTHGGNGDGTLIAYHPNTGDPLATLRMVWLHEALQNDAKVRSQ